MLIQLFLFRPLEKAFHLVCLTRNDRINTMGSSRPLPGSLIDIVLTVTQRCHPLPDPRRYQLLQPLGGTLGALGAHARARGAYRVPLPEHPREELPLGRR